MTSITIPSGVRNIGYNAFFGYSDSTSIYYTGDIRSWLGKNWHYDVMRNGCILHIDGKKVEGELTIPDGIESIPNSAFEYQTGITSVVIPDSVTSIGYNSFSDCSSLTSIYYTGDIRSWLGKDWLNNVMRNGRILHVDGKKVEGELTIPDGIESIPNSAFAYQTGITSVVIPNSVTQIGGSAFYGCSGLTSVSIPDSVTSIGNVAFSDCSGLTSINIPDSVTSIGYNSFSDCSSLPSIYYAVDLAGWCGISGLDSVMSSRRTLYIRGKKVEGEIVLPDGIESIPNCAFYGCSGLTSVSIPDSVTSIGDGAFYGCSGLTSVIIPDSVTSIGNMAFSDCRGLTSVTIGNNVTNIGDNAFSWCSGLTSINIPDSVISIGEHAFSRCSGLTSVSMGNGITDIGNRAFYWCSGLTSINIPDSVKNIGSGAFCDCSTLLSVDFDNVSGWQVDESVYFNNGIDISAEDLSDAATAAKYVTSDYCDYYWKRV